MEDLPLKVATGGASNIDQVIATAGGEAGSCAQNRRRNGRFHLTGKLTLFEADPAGQPIGELECTAGDISRSGIGLRSRRMLYPGRNVFVVVPTPGGNRVLYGLVRHCRYLEGRGCYHIGIALLDLPTSLYIKTWAASVQAADYRPPR